MSRRPAKEPLPDHVQCWLAQPLPGDVRRALARIAATEDVRRVAVLPDVHLAEAVCIGTVIATGRLLYPEAVGGDIGCGAAALRLEAPAEALADERVADRLLQGIRDVVPVITHRRGAAPPLPEALEERARDASALGPKREREARAQFATLGRGNHFLELEADEEGGLWLMVHTGSRGLGPSLRDLHLGQARATDTGLLALEGAAAERYRADLVFAQEYAAASRREICRRVGELVAAVLRCEADWSSYVDCDHNHLRREEHADGTWWVHRKGAVSAWPGEPGLLLGSMGTTSYHVEGRGHGASLCSSSHGAGRRFSRGEARQRIGVRDLRRQLRGVWYDRRREDDLRDEAPAAYKDVRQVLRAQRELTRVVRRLTPVLVYKGGRRR